LDLAALWGLRDLASESRVIKTGVSPVFGFEAIGVGRLFLGSESAQTPVADAELP
jgi:hypothetical protein